MKFDLRVDMKPLGDALQKAGKKTSQNLEKSCLAGLFVLEAYAKINVKANFKQHTGFLAGNWETIIDTSSDKKVEGHTAPLSVYARIQELGGVIRATNAVYLHFQIDGTWYSVKAVTIPARPYLRPAADNFSAQIFEAVGNELQKALEG